MTAARGALTWTSLAQALSLVAGGTALACEPPESPARFVIHHETHGDIGTQILTFACDGEDLVVETDVDVEVKIMFLTVYERQADYREVWRGDQLIAYEAKTDDGGDYYVTTAKVDGDAMIVDGVEGRVRVPLDTVSNHPWNVHAAERTTLFGQRDGRIHQVSVERATPEIVQIGGKRIEAQRYVVSGDLDYELLYGPDGAWLQRRLERDGKTITITRQ